VSIPLNILAAPAMLAAIFAAQLIAVVDGLGAGRNRAAKVGWAGIVAGLTIITEIVAAEIVATEIVASKIVASEIGVMKVAEIGEDGLLLNLTLAQRGEIVGHGFFFVEPYLARVGADEPFIEDAAGKLVEVFLFQGAQHASADLGGVGDGVESDAALLALFAKFFSERSQGQLRRAG
jgi:hypothetical protein